MQELDVNESNNLEGGGFLTMLFLPRGGKHPFDCPLNPIYLTTIYQQNKHSDESHSELFP